MEFLKVLLPMLVRGLKVTLLISVAGIFFGFIIGSISGYALQGKNKPAKIIAGAYIWVIRGIPLIVQALYVYYVLPLLLNTDISSETAGISRRRSKSICGDAGDERTSDRTGTGRLFAGSKL
jgi:glutamine transport system permease protein